MQYASPVEKQTAFEKKVLEAAKIIVDNKTSKINLASLHLIRAEEVPVDGSKKAAVLFVPVDELPVFHQDEEICAAFEKQFQGYDIFIAGARAANAAKRGKDYFSSAKHITECLEDDICHPYVIQGRRTLYHNTQASQKIVLQKQKQDSFGSRAGVAQQVIGKLTKRPVEIIFIE